MSNRLLRAVATLSLWCVLGLARAQDDVPQEADPPDRAARLSLIRGDVSMQPAGEEEWAPAILNRPLTTGDKLWTEPGARAEVQVGQSTVRLAENTGFSFLNLDDQTIQMRMTTGVLNVRVRALEGEIEIDTPNLAVSLVRPGSYRIEVNDAGDATVVKVEEGEAETSGPSKNSVVRAQEMATFRGLDELTADFRALGAPDEFDQWSLERDRQYDRVATSRTAEYVSPDVTGYEDLDEHGSWNPEPEYGYVWTPRHVAVDWAPYRFGRWMWISPWGWTWIDDSPWGYAPFHYGRWAHVRNRWCWVPGPRHVRAVYAPALVGWVGGGPGINVRLTSGGIGWFPLGPREVYLPARRFSHRYIERVNASHTLVNRARVREALENRGRHDYRNRGATTVVTRTTFTSAARVGDRRVRVDERELDRTAVVARSPHIEPRRESRLGDTGRTRVRTPPQTIANRQVVVRRNPPPSGAHLARSPTTRRDTPQVSGQASGQAPGQESGNRLPSRNAELRQRTAEELRNRRGIDRAGADRPARVERPAVQETPHVQTPASNQPRTREDRPPREMLERREHARQQQDRERQVPDQQRPQDQQQRPDDRQRSLRDQLQRRDADVRQQQQQRQDDQQRAARDQQQQQQRERIEQRESPARAVARQLERREPERPRVERREEQPSRSEQRPSEPRQQSQPRQEQPSQPRERSGESRQRDRR